MPAPIVLTKALTAASDNAIALNQTLAAAGAFNLNGASVSGGVATLDTQRRVIFTSAGDDHLITFTVNGTNQAGVTISETVAGTNGGIAATSQDFYTVTAASASGATAGNVKIGTNATGSSQWVIPDRWLVPTEISATLEFPSGAATASVEITDDEVLVPIPIFQAGQPTTQPIPTPQAWVGLSGIGAGPTSGVINRVVAAIRLTITAGTGTVKLTLRQAGLTVS